MFDAGFWEFGLIAIITLIVVGPERMPALAKTAGKYVGKMRNFIAGVKAEVENEKEFKQLKESFDFKESDSILDIVEEVKDTSKDIQKSVKGIDTK